jgi:SAM-dependent methyltransferase
MKKLLYKVYWALHSAIVPTVEFSQRHYARVVQAHVTPATRWLDLGCGHQLWPEFIAGQRESAQKAALLVGLDPDADSVSRNRYVHHRVVGLELPFRDASFNLVTANMVFEHLEHPERVLREIRRVLSPDGLCIFHTVNARYWQTAVGRHLPQGAKNLLVWFSEGRAEADVYPTHYRINTPAAIEALLPTSGLEAEQVQLLNTSAAGRILLLGPLVVLELLWLRLTEHPSLSHHRSNIIAVVRPAEANRSAVRTGGEAAATLKVAV